MKKFRFCGFRSLIKTFQVSRFKVPVFDERKASVKIDVYDLQGDVEFSLVFNVLGNALSFRAFVGWTVPPCMGINWEREYKI